MATGYEALMNTASKLKIGYFPHRSDKIENNTIFNSKRFTLIAGPCAVESFEQLDTIAAFVKSQGAFYLRGGAFKPRTSPYSFQGLGKEGIEILSKVSKKRNLPVVTEVMDTEHLNFIAKKVNILQIGSRNMQNYALLKAVARTHKPILLKRGISATLEEFLYAAEYLAQEGNTQIIFCERGIRTFETATRNTLDLNSVAILKNLTPYPVIVDPSHGTGVKEIILPMAKAAIAVGADGLMVEVHHAPEKALSDGAQSLNFLEFESLVRALIPIAKACNKELCHEKN
ncbi:MAG TPA: 3-deoxy-7-phosphoheptulonate synthase [Gammaproteobacteria bacterium]|nr:3-deoxy-7-phosphoheptulonate synthase [Gammaproteobacteria bacterium]